jgi:hypothetical protein
MATLLYAPTGKPTTSPVKISKTIQTFPVGVVRLIGLHGGEQATSVGANNYAVADTVEDPALNARGVRWFRVTGKLAGSVMFEARSPSGVLDYLQIRFVAGSAGSTMAASFGIPKGESRKGCQFTQAGHFWRLEIPKNGRAIVGLQGGASLRIASNNTSVADTGMEVVQAGLRKLPIVGVREGGAMIEARDATGKVQAYFQVQVGPEQKEYGLLCEGHEAGKRVAELLQSTWNRPEAGPYNGRFGAMTLKRGTRWDGNRMIVYWDHQFVVYLVGSQLWKVKTGDFYNDIFFKALGPDVDRHRIPGWSGGHRGLPDHHPHDVHRGPSNRSQEGDGRPSAGGGWTGGNPKKVPDAVGEAEDQGRTAHVGGLP